MAQHKHHLLDRTEHQRIEGPRKVTGLAQYTSDFNFPGMLYAVPVEATIANGKLLSLDTSVGGQGAPLTCGFSSGNIGRIFRSTPAPASIASAWSVGLPSKMTDDFGST